MYYDRSRILDDINILDLSRIFTGPFCTQILGDLGANIVKVEPPNGDDTRKWGPPFVNNEMASYFAALNRNKQCIVLNLKEDDDYKILEDLVKWADVVIENFRPGVTEKLKIDFNTLKRINKAIVYLSITGFGSHGPFRDHTSYDIIAQSESGMMGITGTEDGDIVKPGVPLADISAGLYGAIGILAALRKTAKTGKAVKVETDLFGGLTSWLTYQSMNAHFMENSPQPMGTAHPNIVPYQSFECKEGKWISIAVGNQKLWNRFVEIMNLSKLKQPKFNTNAKRIKHRNELIGILKQEFKLFPADTWYNELNIHGIPVGRINRIKEVHEHDQIKFTNQLQMIRKNDTLFPVILTPIKLSNTNTINIEPPSNIDEDRENILELLKNFNS